ncbi:hypothetical protein [Legionella sp. WA2024007413]
MAISKTNKTIISNFFKNYNELSGWRRWIFPIKFTQPTNEKNAFIICNFLLSSWFSSFWRSVFPFLDTFAKSDLHRSNQIIGNFDLFNENNFNVIAAHENPYDLWDALSTIGISYKEKLDDQYTHNVVFLTGHRAQANFERIANHKNPNELLDSFVAFLSYSEISTIYASSQNSKETLQADLDAIASSEYNPRQVGKALHLLYCSQKKIDQADRTLIAEKPSRDSVQALCFARQAGLLEGPLAQDIRDLIKTSHNPLVAISVVHTLQLEGLLDERMGKEICAGNALMYSPKEIPLALNALHGLSLSSIENNRKLLIACNAPKKFIDLLNCLQENNLLNAPLAQRNFDLAVGKVHFEAFHSMVSSLHSADLLREEQGQENYEKIAQCDESLAPLFKLLNQSNLLNQESFDRIIHHQKCLRLNIWQKIPPDTFEKDHLLNILRICDNDSQGQLSKMSACIKYINANVLKKNRKPEEPTFSDNTNDLVASTSLQNF